MKHSTKGDRADRRRGARTDHGITGRHFKLSYEDALLARQLYAIGRVGIVKPLTVEEIAEKFGVNHMTIRRVVQMDETELSIRKQIERMHPRETENVTSIEG